MGENENIARAIYVIKDGKAVKYGDTAGSGGKEVYVFETEADFDAAIAAGTIPDGVLVVKTYDGDEIPDTLESVEKINMSDQIVVKQNDIEKLATIQVVKDCVKIWDGKNLGNGVTSKQWDEIEDGTFCGMSVVDYWEINNIRWRYSHTNYWMNTGDVPCTTPHIALVPDTGLYTAPMNDTNTTEGGYVGSKMRQTGLEQAKTIINEAFGAEHILNHREALINSVTNGKPSNYAWYNSTVELMNEPMAYGGYVFTPACDGITISYRYTIDKSQLALFFLRANLISNREHCWLRDSVSNGAFAHINQQGRSSISDASDVLYVRPVFGICKSNSHL